MMRVDVRTALLRHLHDTRPAGLQILFENRPVRLRPDASGWLHLHLDWQTADPAFSVLDGASVQGRLLACLAVSAGQGTDSLDSRTDWLAAALAFRCIGPVCLGALQAAAGSVPPNLSGPGLYTVCLAVPFVASGQAASVADKRI